MATPSEKTNQVKYQDDDDDNDESFQLIDYDELKNLN